jgi:hypothetical protein
VAITVFFSLIFYSNIFVLVSFIYPVTLETTLEIDETIFADDLLVSVIVIFLEIGTTGARGQAAGGKLLHRLD